MFIKSYDNFLPPSENVLISIIAMSFLITIVGVKQAFIMIFTKLRYRSIFIKFLKWLFNFNDSLIT